MLLPVGEGGRSSSLSVPKVPDALLSAEPIRERSDCMVEFLRPAPKSKSKSMGGLEGCGPRSKGEMELTSRDYKVNVGDRADGGQFRR